MALEKEQENQAALSKEKTSLDKELTDRRKSIEELKKKAEALASDVDAIEKRVQAHTQALSSTGDSKNISQKAAELKKAVFLNEKDQQTKQTAWQEALQSLESKKAEISSAERELALAEEELKNQQAEVKDLEFRVRDASNSRKGSEQNVGALTQELHQLKAKERNLSAHADDLARELLELNRSYSALDAKLKERGAQGGSLALATDFLLTQGNLGKISGIRGKVEDLLSFDSEIATAVSIAGGNRLQSLVVDTEATAQACIELLNREKKGRVTLLPLNKMLPVRPKGKSLVVQKAPGCKGFVLDLVKYDGALESVMSYVFGETLVMDSLENARRAMGGVRLVTLRGELIEASGAMTGGSLGQMGKGKQESMATLRNISESLGNKTAEEALVKSELKTVSERLRQVAEGLARHSGEGSGNANALDDLAKDLQRGKEKLKG
ncbi:MAG: hypothetical protein M1144_01060, partial [Candidatus Thermoplasmatota archaeon]|nr:hypothetical protein [Candidatus Thermoplasmatota archaeon]